MQDPSPTNDPPYADFGADAAGPNGPAMHFMLSAELQDHLMSVVNDLERLLRLLEDAGESLSTHFFSASTHVQDLAEKISDGGALPPGSLAPVLQDIAGAVTAMQFQDMSTQLINHTMLRIRSCSDRLASDAFGDDGDGSAAIVEAPLRPNPVTQDEVDAGSVELF